MIFEITYKMNGHIKKIRKKQKDRLKQQIINQIQKYLQQILSTQKMNKAQQRHKQKQRSQRQLSVLNINIRPLQQNETNFKQQQKRELAQGKKTREQNLKQKHMMGRDNSLIRDQQEIKENLQMLKHQVLHFQNNQDILNFIQTEVNLAPNVQTQLTQLLFYSLKLLFQLLKPLNYPSFDSINLHQISHFNFQNTLIVKQKLQLIEENCLNTLNLIKQERKKLQSCAICFNKKINTLILPCMHLVMCQICSSMVNICPFCKSKIQSRKIVYK